MLSVFYFIFDRDAIFKKREKQTPIRPDATPQIAPLSKWLLDYTNHLGDWLDKPESAKAVDTFSNNPEYTVFQYVQPDRGWKTLNDFFSRMVKPEYRPIAPRYTVASPCNAKFDLYKPISGDGDVDFSGTISLKGFKWPISKLLADTGLGETFKNGIFMHFFLLPNNYHRVHAPVSGDLIKRKTIPGDVYLEVEADEKKGRLRPIPRFMEPPKNNFDNVRALDTPGYQWNQVRGMWVFDTDKQDDTKIGKVVLFAVGMAQISSVKFDKSPEGKPYKDVGEIIQKDEEIGYLKYGGSDYILLFEKDKVEFNDNTPKNGCLYLQGAALVSKKF
ncbi:phosphatidylserine decarboxylase [Aspergillus terreus]|uniref:Phosphatidylserine decarboxylase n=1 Tax=Aspergillus terreus TaxID=33178 RepID=A0A5M3YVV4_ASPTE|nr:hypothetical protein ATETN484_0005007900 [Aspergillus terreus]GFF16744.1 phosphatidylserine decarboxylase [Aspergillus terreus]